jgi:hypothetical protein
MKCKKCSGYVGSVEWVGYSLWTNGMRITDDMLAHKCDECRDKILADMAVMLFLQANRLVQLPAWSPGWDDYHYGDIYG